MFADAAYCAAERGDIDAAVQLANEGRARLLAVALKLQALPLTPDQKHSFEALQATIRDDQALIDAETGDGRAMALDRLSAHRQDLLKIVESAGPQTDGEGAPADLARDVTGAGDAMLIPVITTKGAKLLLLAGSPAKTWTALDYPDVTLSSVTEILAGKREAATHGWIEAYFANYFDGEEQQKRWPKWLDAVDGIGLQLWTLFGEQLNRALKAKDVRPGARLILMPSGRLGVLPLGLAQNPASKRRLLDSYDIVYAPSLEALASAHRQIDQPQSATLAAVINPTGDLPGTEKEGALVASHFASGAQTILARENATVPAVLAALKGKTYWHFASHGTFAWQAVTSSALIMSGAERLSISRLSQAGDLGRPRLVVLSACETGLSEIDTANPDEFIGLPGSFVGLGAAGVVGTLWPVSDDATALLIAKFYELHLDKALSPPAALRQAQLWLRDASADDLNRFAKSQKVDRRHVAEIGQSLDRLSANTTRLGVAAPAAAKGQPAQGPAPAPTDVSKPYVHPYYWGGFVYTGL